MPRVLRQRLRLPVADMGVDGVFVTATDEAVCYQSKFRTGRPALSWTEFSTFYGLADVGARRPVFTNCDDIARVAEEQWLHETSWPDVQFLCVCSART